MLFLGSVPLFNLGPRLTALAMRSSVLEIVTAGDQCRCRAQARVVTRHVGLRMLPTKILAAAETCPVLPQCLVCR
jgi:hypothetical protein